MNPEKPEPTQDPKEAPKRNNSGLFVILLVGVLILLAVFGGSSQATPMTMDQLWVNLYAGKVESVAISDTAKAFHVKLDGSERKDIVAVPDARMVWGDVRQVLAKGLTKSQSIGIEELTTRIADGSLTPLKGYPLRIRLRVDPENEESQVVERQRFFLDYADASGIHYAEIDGTTSDDSSFDLAAVVAAFEAAQTRPENRVPLAEGLTFDTTKGLSTEKTSGLTTLLMSFGPILLFLVLFWFLFMRQMKGQGQGLLNFGKSRAKVYNKENRTGVTFDDVAGIEEALDEVEEITEFLKFPEKFTRLGGHIPRGVMLVGPPGTGKTLLAKAIAGEAGVPFISISGSDFVEMFVGVGASRVRDLFEGARKEAPCIIFLDEIDAVGRKRGSGMGGGNDEREQTLNAILVEMDGFSSDDRVIVIAATNRPDVLDNALLRPGRFDRQVTIDLPDVKGREKILAVHTRKVKIDPSVNLEVIARGTPGFSGAELAALTNEAAILAALREHLWVTQDDLEEARDKVRFGRQKKSAVMEEEDKRITAYHEAGHAVVNVFMKHTDPVHKITIIPRGMALGATMFLPEKDRMHWSYNRLLDEICTLYGGRVAEEAFLEDITTGASNDIERATDLARRMITHWGMSKKLGPVCFGEKSGNNFLGSEYGAGKEHSQITAKIIDEEVGEILAEQHQRALTVLEENRPLMERVAQALIRYENISKEEFKQLVDGTAVEDLHPIGEPVTGEERKTPPPMPGNPPSNEEPTA
ncbi:MAG: ATP-dependent zinc metalloprotease FtsH [Planctomycetota bacterium]|nr:ATP-dependent zinc metalloprotease FtsH [Planctomycetota bacterium]MDA1113306.1 ATP-dependent zinc metalloprotease FtsH [Planctomycetota bacterium]